MKFEEVIRYAIRKRCSTLFVVLSLGEYKAMNDEVIRQRFWINHLPKFGENFVFSGSYGECKIMFIRDDSVIGVRFEEFSPLTPKDYMNFAGGK